MPAGSSFFVGTARFGQFDRLVGIILRFDHTIGTQTYRPLPAAKIMLFRAWKRKPDRNQPTDKGN